MAWGDVALAAGVEGEAMAVVTGRSVVGPVAVVGGSVVGGSVVGAVVAGVLDVVGGVPGRGRAVENSGRQ